MAAKGLKDAALPEPLVHVVGLVTPSFQLAVVVFHVPLVVGTQV
jgi:hypothetical protein